MVSTVPEVRPTVDDSVADVVTKQISGLKLLERRSQGEGNGFSLPVIICEDVDSDTPCSSCDEQSPLVKCSSRFLQVPRVDIGVERRPPN